LTIYNKAVVSPVGCNENCRCPFQELKLFKSKANPTTKPNRNPNTSPNPINSCISTNPNCNRMPARDLWWIGY